MHEQSVFLSCASNKGNRLDNLRKAIYHLRTIVRIEAISELYQASVYSDIEDDTLICGVIRGTTSLPPHRLLDAIKAIELILGRRHIPNVPQTIDIDILLYGSLQMDTTTLIIPHPRLPQRAYILKPLVDIAPSLIYPGLYYTVQQLLQDADDANEIRRHCSA